MNYRRLSELENEKLTDEQKRIMDDFDRTVQRKNWLYEQRVAGVGTSVHLEAAMECDTFPSKVCPGDNPSSKGQKLRGDSLLCEEDW